MRAFDTSSKKKTQEIDMPPASGMRLGHFAEELFATYLHLSGYKSIHRNLQIIQHKQTVGELDFIAQDEAEQWHHIELAYKIYCFDPSMSQEELSCCVGSNQKDLLIDKLAKLRDHQLPLLHKESTQDILRERGIPTSSILQSVCLKGQLYVPYEQELPAFSHLNPNAVAGYYIRLEQIEAFHETTDQFFIPKKLNWMLSPDLAVDWQPYEIFKGKASALLEDRWSPLCWRKTEKGQLSRFFLVWW